MLAHIDLEVASGESLLLAGANGCGKTTLLRVLAGLSRPSAGMVRLLGRDPHSERLASRRALSMVTHRSYLYDGLTAFETLRIWSRLCNDGTFDEGQLASLLDEVGLTPHRDLPVGGFSSGMRKRLTLLRTRIEKPDIIFLDEPLASLDSDGKRLVERWIRREVDRGATVVVVSHAVERMSRICRRAVLLEDGQIAWEGPAPGLPEQLEERE